MSWHDWFVQWASFIGVSLDIVGFCILSWEWSHAMKLARRDFKKALTWAVDFSMDEPTKGQIEKSTREYEQDAGHRMWLFGLGAVLIFLGFLFQAFGSWPRSNIVPYPASIPAVCCSRGK